MKKRLPPIGKYSLAACLNLNENSDSALKNKTIVILCHGLFTDKNSKTLQLIENELINYVYGIVTFDFHGCGESKGYEEWSVGGYEDEVEDLRDVVIFLKQEFFNVQLILGHSRAATVVLMYGAKYGDIPYIASLSGRFNLSQGLSKFFPTHELKELMENDNKVIEYRDRQNNIRKVSRLNVALNIKISGRCLKRRCNIKLENILHKVKSDEVLILHAKDDKIIPVEDALKIAEFIKRKTQVHLIDTGGHTFDNHESVEQIVKFLSKFVV